MPEPLRPIRAVASPAFSLMSMFRTAATSPWTTVTPRAVRRGGRSSVVPAARRGSGARPDSAVRRGATARRASRTDAIAVRDRLPASRPGVVVVGSPADDQATLVAAVNGATRNEGRDASTPVKRLLDGRGSGSSELANGGGIPSDRLALVRSADPQGEEPAEAHHIVQGGGNRPMPQHVRRLPLRRPDRGSSSPSASRSSRHSRALCRAERAGPVPGSPLGLSWDFRPHQPARA